jgi:hypothetical protein
MLFSQFNITKIADLPLHVEVGRKANQNTLCFLSCMKYTTRFFFLTKILKIKFFKINLILIIFWIDEKLVSIKLNKYSYKFTQN